MIRRATDLFIVWALLFSGVAYLFPGLFTSLKPAIIPLLGVVMFGMGVTLSPRHFSAVLRRPKVVVTGAALQFLLMPLIAWLVGIALALPAELLVGLVMVGACPGGTASNVICYLARGDVALSITMTAVSTVASVIMTPALTWLYVGQVVPVPVGKMLLDILLIVILPVVLGVMVNTYWRRFAARVGDVFPLISVAAIVFIIAIIVALNAQNLAGIAHAAVAGVILHNLLGLATGYGFATLLGFTPVERRTLAIEVGMQNSGLGVALALKYFSAAAALPGAVFSIWHNLSGAALAGYWARRPAAGAEPTRSS